ncbi:MAG: globin [Terrimesophilobacter sp.]
MSEQADAKPKSEFVPERQLAPVTLRSSETGPAVQGELFEQIGGSATFDLLVTRFYDGVQFDPVLWPLYPQHDLAGAIHRLSSFLQQYWGGPTTYSDERGHPRLRMRHVAFKVNPDARDRWLGHMREALDTLELPPLHDATLWGYLDRAAHSLVNTFDD